MDTLWLWLDRNAWLYWLPAWAVAITALILFFNRRKYQWRQRATPSKLPSWTLLTVYISLALIFLLIIVLLDAGGRRLIIEFFLPPQYPIVARETPIYLQAAVFSLLGVPLILQGFTFGWLRRLINPSSNCPNCKYDLRSLINRNGKSHTTCPECGYVPGVSKPIRKHQRRKRLIIPGLLLVLTGFSLSGYRYYHVNNLLLPAWFTQTYTNLTGDFRLWTRRPTPLSPSLTLEKLPTSIAAALRNRGPTFLTHTVSGFEAFFAHSRKLDLILDKALAPRDTIDQFLILRAHRYVIAQSITSPTRANDLKRQRVPLDDIIERFFTPDGKPRENLDPATLARDYLDPQTPPQTKAAILAFGYHNLSFPQAFQMLEGESDPLLRNLICTYGFRPIPWHTPVIQAVHDAGISDELFTQLYIDGIATGMIQFVWTPYPVDPNCEARILNLLESDTSPLFLTQRLNPTNPAIPVSVYRSYLYYLHNAPIGLTTPLHAARWQALINDLKLRIEELEKAAAEPALRPLVPQPLAPQPPSP